MLYSKLGPTLPFTRQEIADMAGTTTETAIRVMSRLKARGIIRARGMFLFTPVRSVRATALLLPIWRISTLTF